MAIQFFDPGGEPYFSLGLASSGTAGGAWSATSNSSLSSSAPAGRLTQYAIVAPTNGAVDKVVSNFTEMWMGGAYYVQAGASFATANPIMIFADGVSDQVDIRVNASGNILITKNGTTLATSANALTLGQGWIYLELRAKIDPSAGSAEVWVNGVQWATVSGTNTRATANTQTNRARWANGCVTGVNCFWKDMYLLDTGTGVETTRLGDQSVPVLYPSGVGTNQQWSNTGGASQTVSVQDGTSHSGTWPDGDTSYISDSVSGHISDFAHDSLSLTGLISGVRHLSYVRSDAGAANFDQVAISGATTHVSSARSAGATYNYFDEILETDPNIALTLTSVATGTGVYTGTITGGGSNAYAGQTFNISGFVTAANNGNFVCTASTTTILTLSNASSASETHAATASSFWTRTNLNSATFGVKIP